MDMFLMFVVVKGQAVYTSVLLPITNNPTNITNTTILFACQDSDATTAPVSPGTITATGAVALNESPFLL